MFENFDRATKGYVVANGVPISILATVELELDNYIKTAMEWPEREGGIWDTNEVAKLRDEVAKTKASTAGRGLAIALWHMHGGDSVSNKFRSPDAVIRDAVQRYQEAKELAKAEAMTAENVAMIAAEQPVASAALDEEQKARIREAIEGGFDRAQLAKMFKVPVAEIEALA